MVSNRGSVDRRSVHTEVRLPVEAVLSRVILYVFSVIEILIGARFLLRLFGANSEVPVVSFVYDVAAVLMMPFEAIFPTSEVVEGSIIEWSALAAIAGYVVLAWGLTALIGAVGPRRHAETVEQVVKQDDME